MRADEAAEDGREHDRQAHRRQRAAGDQAAREARGVGISMLTLLAQVSMPAFHVLLSRGLGRSGSGLYAWSNMLVEMLSVVTLLGMDIAVTRETSVAVASVIFGTLLNPQVGLLPWLGISTNPSILENPKYALLAVAVTTIWQNLGLSFIVMSSGLQAIPDEIIEASEVDGAGPFRQFFRVTLPLLSPTVFFAVVVGSIVAFQTFGQIDLLTQGGPLQKTNVLTYAIYTALRGEQNEGKAAVLAVALFFVTLVLTVAQMRILERRVHYGD